MVDEARLPLARSRSLSDSSNSQPAMRAANQFQSTPRCVANTVQQHQQAGLAKQRVSATPETILIGADSARAHFEAFVDIAHQGGDSAVEVSLVASTPLIRLAKSHCVVEKSSSARVRVMLDMSSHTLRRICKKFLSLSAAPECLLGFITANTERPRQELNVDVVLSREVCRTVMELAMRSSVDSSSSSSLPQALQEVKVPVSTPTVTADSQLAAGLQLAALCSVDRTRLDTHERLCSVSTSSSQDCSSTTACLESSVVQNFLRREEASALDKQHSKVAGEPKKLAADKSGVYFRRDSAQFGAVVIGSLTRARIELCNGTDEDVTVFLGDPALPFVLLHNEVHIRPRSYMRIPLRFVPVAAGQYTDQLVAQTADGRHHTTVNLTGFAQA